MNIHQPMLNFEPSPEDQQYMIPEHRTTSESQLRKGLPPVQDGQPLRVEDVFRDACIISGENE